LSTFDERKDAFQNKFARDQQIQFKIEASRNKMLGFWAADLLKLSDSEAHEYVKEVVRSDFEEAGDEDVFRKLMSDLEGKVTEDELRTKMAKFFEEAKEKFNN